MAAYSQTTNQIKILKRKFENMQDIHEKETLFEILDLINTEFAAMETAGLASYTVTSGLNASMDARLINMANTIKRRCLEEFNTLFTTECASVVTNGLSYTKTTQIVRNMKWTLQNWPNISERMMMFDLIASIETELDLLVAAS